MTGFRDSEWAKAEFSREYRDKADIYVIERERLFTLLGSFYRHFLGGKGRRAILDLGCGDGVVAHKLLKTDSRIDATLVDGSIDMLESAKRRLTHYPQVRYIRASFQELIGGEIELGRYDLIVSSLAIHHLTLGEKEGLYRKVYTHLHPGGFFLNIDLVKACWEELEEWYMVLWKEWIEERKSFFGLEEDIFRDIVRRYTENEDNKPDTLDDQLGILEDAGFLEVDCYYKYGIFTIFGGRR